MLLITAAAASFNGGEVAHLNLVRGSLTLMDPTYSNCYIYTCCAEEAYFENSWPVQSLPAKDVFQLIQKVVPRL